jgi:hypothetical protein
MQVLTVAAVMISTLQMLRLVARSVSTDILQRSSVGLLLGSGFHPEDEGDVFLCRLTFIGLHGIASRMTILMTVLRKPQISIS